MNPTVRDFLRRCGESVDGNRVRSATRQLRHMGALILMPSGAPHRVNLAVVQEKAPELFDRFHGHDFDALRKEIATLRADLDAVRNYLRLQRR